MIFIVDDDPDLSDVIGQAIREWTHAGVRVFDDPLRAVDALAHEEAELLITDLSMPWLDGVHVLASARERRPDLPVIVISAYARGAVVAASYGAAFLSKPIDVRKLIAAVEHARMPARAV